MNQYDGYTQKMLYDGTARESLGIDLYDMKWTIEDELLRIRAKFYYFGRDPMGGGYLENDEVEFFLKAACLSYIPYDTAGYAYIKEKLGGASVADYRYETVLRKLTYMGIRPDERDRARLHALFVSQETGKTALDHAGLAAVCLRLHSAVEGLLLSRGRLHSMGLGETYGEYLKTVCNAIKEKGLCEIDLAPFLPEYEPLSLSDADREYLDRLFREQAFPALYEYELGEEEYGRVERRETTSFLVGGRDRDVRIGDKLFFLYDNIGMNAEVTGLRRYADYTELPNERYGFGIGSYNPYFYDNESARERGGLVLADFRVGEAHRLHDTFTVLYHAHQLAGAEDASEIYLAKRDRGIYHHVGYSSEFVLKECMGGRTLYAVSPRPAEINLSREGLLSSMEEGIPSIPTRAEIQNGCFRDEDYEDGVYLIRLKIKTE